jgi:hypothetical protein
MGSIRIMAAMAFSLLLISGCAHDKLLRLETRDYVKVAEKTEASGRAFYDGIVESDRNLWAELHAIDENCTPKSLRPSAFDPDTNGDGKLDDRDDGFCRVVSDEKGEIVSQEIERKMFGPQYAALSFIRSYLAALATASADPQLNAAKEFKSAAADLALLSQALKAKQNPLTEDQVQAVGELVDFIEALSQDHRSAKEVRRIVDENQTKVDAAFDVLIAAMRSDQGLRRSTQGSKDMLEAYRGIQVAVKDKEKEDRRRRLIEMHYARVDAEENEIRRVAACEKLAERKMEAAKQDPRIDMQDAQAEKDICPFAEAGAMRAAKQANADFVALALEGRMSAKQKARLIRMQREHFMRAVSIFIDLAGAL